MNYKPLLIYKHKHLQNSPQTFSHSQFISPFCFFLPFCCSLYFIHNTLFPQPFRSPTFFPSLTNIPPLIFPLATFFNIPFYSGAPLPPQYPRPLISYSLSPQDPSLPSQENGQDKPRPTLRHASSLTYGKDSQKFRENFISSLRGIKYFLLVLL